MQRRIDARVLSWGAGVLSMVMTCAAMADPDWVEISPGAPTPRPASAPPTSPTPPTSTSKPAPAPLPPPEPTRADGGSHHIERVVIAYERANPNHPSADEVLQAKVPLLETPDGYVAPREGYPTTDVVLADIPTLANQTFYDSALARIAPSVVIRLQQLGLIGVYAEPDRDQFVVVNGQVRDLRAADDTTLKLIITTGHVTEVNTTGLGERLPEDQTFNNPVHARIRANSPVQPGDGAEQEEKGTVNLLRRDRIDRYVNFLNRHPGRRVDVAVAATGEEPGAVALDYLVTENRPWLLYGQVANTGTESTNALRERFGFIHNQLTNNDDVFSLEYVTANFDGFHAAIASYERPLFHPRVRGRAYGSWYTYSAADVGQPDSDFQGDGWAAGGELIWNFLQLEDHFFDLVGGFRYDWISVDNKQVDITGNQGVWLGYTGVRYARDGIAASTRAEAMLNFSLNELSESSVNDLGRFDASRRFAFMNINLEQSFFLEPLLDPKLSEDASLVHEFYLSGRAQLALGNRLIPNYEQVAGGLYTVRGYKEAVVAGDSAFIGTVEYRFHLPRSFSPDPQPAKFMGAPFRFSPQYKYGPVDWDFILRAFVDLGVTLNSDKQPYEENNTLVGTGVGAELALSRHLNARVDFGWALLDAKTFDGRVDDHAGDFRIHFVVTVVF